MELIDPKVIVVKAPTKDEMYKDIASAARKCYQSEGKSKRTDAEMVELIISNDHGEVQEMSDITVDFIVSRDTAQQIVRHRHTSKAQESQRYVRYDNVQFVKTHSWDSIAPFDRDLFLNCFGEAEDCYGYLLTGGLKPQEARGVLGGACKTELRVKANVREWRHILKLRTALPADPNIRDVMCPLLDYFHLTYPEVFGDIQYPNQGVKRAEVVCLS